MYVGCLVYYRKADGDEHCGDKIGDEGVGGHLLKVASEFCVTTAAAEAQGQMIHVSTASASVRLSPVRLKAMITATTAATVST